jgi:hypothetical protein
MISVFGLMFSDGVFEMGKRSHATDGSKDATVEPNREW